MDNTKNFSDEQNYAEGEARNYILGNSDEQKGISIKGYDFNQSVDYDKLIDHFSSTGMQGDFFYKAIKIIDKMIKNKAFIYLGYTSNMVTSGLREIFRYLAEHKMINVIVTSGGGIEEDFIKCFGDFILGDFRAKGAYLRNKRINRAGNIFIPNSRYCEFEDFAISVFEELYNEQKTTGKVFTPSDIVWRFGEKVNNKDSIYYWCWKNRIPVFCPTFTDGSLGDMIYFFKSKHPDFKIDIAEDIWKLNNLNLGVKKAGVIILGEGSIKHHILNANLFRNGADYSVYINNSPEYDGSDSGALPEEAVSWGKLRPNSERVKVFGDAILIFPFIVAKTFARNQT